MMNEKMPDENENAAKKKRKKTILILSLLPFVMFAAGFALVPFYKLICSIAGINASGYVVKADDDDFSALSASASVETREIRIEFDETINAGLNVDFYPMDRHLTLKAGQKVETAFFVRNNEDHAIVTQSIPGITPWQATKYVKKMECFCFEQQTLEAGEEKEMGVTFYVDPDLPEEYTAITLSYTIMDTNRNKIMASGQAKSFSAPSSPSPKTSQD